MLFNLPWGANGAGGGAAGASPGSAQAAAAQAARSVELLEDSAKSLRVLTIQVMNQSGNRDNDPDSIRQDSSVSNIVP